MDDLKSAAPPGHVWVCTACGKRSRDKYGFDRIDRGYDASCMLHAVLCHEEKDAEGNWVIDDALDADFRERLANEAKMRMG